MSDVYGNLEDLLASVRRRTEQHAVARASAAEEQAERRLVEARAEAQRRREALLAEGRRDAEEACRRCLAVADLERRERRLDAREARLDAVFDAAGASLIDAYGDDGLPPEILRRLALDAAASLPPGEVTLHVDTASRARLDDAGEALPNDDHHTFVLDAAPLEGRHGVVARAGRASVDATLEGRLTQARDRLRGRVAKLLEPPGGPQHDPDEAKAS